jgi:hypothetical protein
MGECRPYVENYTVDASIFDPGRKVRVRNNVLSVLSGAGESIGHVPASGARLRVSGVGTRFILMYVVSSFEEQTVDALATGAEEGRSNLR